MSHARPIALRFLLLFVTLVAVTLPFHYHLLPSVGLAAGPLNETLVDWTSRHILHITRAFTISTDSAAMYVHMVNMAAIAAAGAALWSALDRRMGEHRELGYALTTVAGYYLALQLVIYGFDKIFKHQFYLPEPNILFTTLGRLRPDILYWSTLGASRAYNVITGVLEIIPAILLLWRRTRIIGGICALAVVVNIVAINFSFDISVKLYSLFLLLLAAIVAAPGARILIDLFLRRRQVTAHQWRPAPGDRARLVHAVVKAVAVVAIVVEGLYPHVAAGNFNDDLAPRPPLHGAYDVETFVRNGDTLPPMLTDTVRFRRIFFHRDGYFITQTMDERMQDHLCSIDTAARSIRLGPTEFKGPPIDYALSNRDSTLELRGVIDGDTIALRARRIDLARLPLLAPSFHWTIEEYR